MPTINQLSSVSSLSGGDLLPVYVPNNGDARKVSITQLLAYFQTSFAAPTVATNLYVPATGFNQTVPTPVSEQQWMILQPAGTLATGTITLPLNTGVADGTEVLVAWRGCPDNFSAALEADTLAGGSVRACLSGASAEGRSWMLSSRGFEPRCARLREASEGWSRCSRGESRAPESRWSRPLSLAGWFLPVLLAG